LLPALLGCDIVQGFQDAGDALFPEQSTHLSSPALRLVKGSYGRIGLASGQQLSVLARPADDSSSLFVMRFANPVPCEIPNVGRYRASRNPKRPEAGIAYFHEQVTRGTLHFADTSCKIFDFEIEDALLPLGETEHTVIVWAGGDLLEVDPGSGERTTLASEVTNAVDGAFSGRTLIVTGQRLEVFGSDWKSQGTFGQNVAGVLKTATGALYIDDTGLRRLSSGGGATTKDEPIAEDVCHLGMRDDTWTTFHSPCAEGRLRALHEPSGKLYDLEIDADPQYLRLLPAWGSAATNPLEDPFWFLFLRDVSASGGTFVVRDPSGKERVIGEGATLDRSALSDTGTESYGYALTNVAGGVGDYVYFDGAGEARTLAKGVIARNKRLIVDWDGSAGNLAAVSRDKLVIVAERVPENDFEFPDPAGQWTVVFHDWQGESGRLSRFVGTIESLSGTPVTALVSPELELVAPSVGIATTASLGSLIPGTIFLENYDVESGTGKLSYENAELRFKATVDRGVSDYLVTNSDLLYTIPHGEGQGIWLATGK
jgi:hypothetical protein